MSFLHEILGGDAVRTTYSIPIYMHQHIFRISLNTPDARVTSLLLLLLLLPPMHTSYGICNYAIIMFLLPPPPPPYCTVYPEGTVAPSYHGGCSQNCEPPRMGVRVFAKGRGQ